MRCERVWRNARLATLAPSRPGIGIIDNGVIAANGGNIIFAGAAQDAPTFQAAERIDCEGRWITPGLIDCHTHLVYAGNRAAEFEQRLNGASYEEIARAGGGISATVRQTRAATRQGLVTQALPRLDAMMAEGVSTVEIKSGYGLRLKDEIKQLTAARDLEGRRAVKICTTFLGAHTLPPESAGDPDGYVDEVCHVMIPRIAKADLAEAVDVFCETIGFSRAQSARVLAAAAKTGLAVKMHAEQLSNSGGAALAAESGALSADHLEYVDESGAAAMAAAGTVAVLLPGAFYFLRETKVPPVAMLRSCGVKIAVASDCNPGTSPLTSPLLVMNMAATLFRLTVEECLAGMTREAARALGHLAELGSLEAGKRCDLAIWNVNQLSELVYNMGLNPLHARVWRGL
ncbi:MAG: imidazolonepropionase [Alphaproteobacteria bacterium]|nr:imidazolonepropionase [Alphaproteobacteria bacterium]